MRLVRLIGVAAMMAVVGAALIGAGAASASVEKTVLCKVKENLCQAANLWSLPATILLSSSLVIFSGTLSIKCQLEISVQYEASHKHELLAKAIQHQTTSCKGCTDTLTTTLPAPSLLPDGLGGGQLAYSSNLVVLLAGCPLGLKCTGTIPASATLGVTGGSIGGTAQAEAANVATQLSGGLCGSKATMNAGPGESEPFLVTEVNGTTSGDLFVSLESHK